MGNLQQIFGKTINSLSVPAFAIDKNHQVVFWNNACEKLTGIHASEILGTYNHWKGFYPNKRPCMVDIIVDQSNEEMIQYYESSLKNEIGCAYRHESWLLTNGEMRFIAFEATGIYNERNELIGAFEILYDLTDYRSLNEKLKATYNIFDKISDGVMITDHDQKILFINKAMEEMSQYSKEELFGKDPSFLSGTSPDPIFKERLEKHFSKHSHWKGEFLNKRKDGSIYQVSSSVTKILLESGEVNYITLITNITEQLKIMEQLNFMAHYDYLTKLPNRSLLEEKIEVSIQKCEQEKKKCAVLFLDLNKFKHVNDTFGHYVGDLLLKEVGIRLQNSVRSIDTVARQGGDEFVILLDNIKNKDDLHIMARKILSCFSENFNIMGVQISIKASLGIAIYPDDGVSTHDLLKNADRSMYWNKEHAPSHKDLSIFNDDINKKLIEDFSIINKLNNAIPGKLEVYFQPQYCAENKEIFGAEALIRWHDSELGWVSPDKFIPLVEERGMLNPLWELVLDSSCNVIKETGIRVSVNLSPTQLLDDHIVENVEKSINKYEIDPYLLTLEITESAFMANFEYAKETLIKLKKLGIELALDDFGTGYSSLSYLYQLPLDYLKIDKSFIQNDNNMSIVTSIVDMADKLNLSTIAEGIETLEQLLLLKYSGCSIIQGFYYSRPLNKNAYLEFIKNNYKEKINLICKSITLELGNMENNTFNQRYLTILQELERVEKSIQENPSKDNIKIELNDLSKSILSSLITEELELLKHHDSDYEFYKKHYDNLLEKYAIYSNNILIRGASVEPLIKFIRRWIMNHLLLNKKDY